MVTSVTEIRLHVFHSVSKGRVWKFRRSARSVLDCFMMTLHAASSDTLAPSFLHELRLLLDAAFSVTSPTMTGPMRSTAFTCG